MSQQEEKVAAVLVDNEERTAMIYVLALEHGKFYVGKTTRAVSIRFQEHATEHGPEWTRRYRPIEIAELAPLESRYHEDNTVKTFMERYGIDNVRGGAYSAVVLSNGARRHLTKEIRHAQDECFTCGASGHFQSRCPTRRPMRVSPSPFTSAGGQPSIAAAAAAAPLLSSPPVVVTHRTHRKFCFGMTAQQRPCRMSMNLDDNGYCHHHERQFRAPTAASTATATAPVTPSRSVGSIGERANDHCLGVTPQGTPCRVPLYLFNGYCQCHRDHFRGTLSAAGSPAANQKSPSTPTLRVGSNDARTDRHCLGVSTQGTPCRVPKYLDDNGYCQGHREQSRSCDEFANWSLSVRRRCRNDGRPGHSQDSSNSCSHARAHGNALRENDESLPEPRKELFAIV